MNWDHITTENQEIRLQGKGVSPGLVIGRIHVNSRGFVAPSIFPIEEKAIDSELVRFQTAVYVTKKQLEKLQKAINSVSGERESKIFEAHILLIEDKTLHRKVEAMLREELLNIDHCYYRVMCDYMAIFKQSEDAYMSERTADLEDIAIRFLDNLLKVSHAGEIDYDHILVSHDLTPSDTISLDRQRMLGFVTEQGSYTSHTAILARSLGIPAIIGVESAVAQVQEHTLCILDGVLGLLILNPSQETLETYKKRHKENLELKARLQKESPLPCVTTDGHHITLSSNVEFSHEIELVNKHGAEGVGLFRTEFYLLENKKTPTEDQQADLYSKVTREVAPHLSIFRTLDSGGDKMSGEPLSTPEPNPFLGWRGIRFSLARPEIFKVQLRALLRATVHGNVGIMFPMISQIAEIRKAKALLEECRQELLSEGYDIQPNYQIGAMVEVPAAALLAEEIAKEVDFFSIGTNDLVQYTTAVDRVNPLVNDLYRPADPGVLRLIDLTVRGGKASDTWTGICGEMASDIELLPLLLGVGIEELSVGVNMIPIVKSAIRRLNLKDCQELTKKALKLSRAIEIREASRAVAKKSYPILLEHQVNQKTP